MPSIEAGVRSAFSWTILKLFGGASRMPVPDWRARPYRILFIRDDGIGDLMVSQEIMRAIAESSPTFTFDVLASPSNAPYARTLPFVNEVIVHTRGFLPAAWPTWRKLRGNRYDVAIDGRVAIANVNKQTQALLLASGAPWRIGLAGRRNDRVYSVPVEMPVIDHWIHAIVALGRPFGISQESRDWLARLALGQSETDLAERMWSAAGDVFALRRRPRVLVNFRSASADRQWPTRQFGELLLALRSRFPEATIVVPTMPQGDAEASLAAGPAKAVAMPLDLDAVRSMTATADLVVSPDTAITVIASAFHVPILALMRKNTEQWVPYRMIGRVAYSDDPRSLNALPTERVVSALDALIAELGPARGWT
jgi:ADP-heptose:LPS heptosyltransferase